LQPLVIRSTETGFELIAGERRLRAAKEAGLDRVPVLIRQAAESESMELALVENLQREDLNPLETAAAYGALMDGFGLTKEQLATRLGKSRAAVTNTLRLMRLPESIQALVLAQKLSEGHARALLPLEAEEAMLRVAQRVQDGKLSVRKTEEIVREQLAQPQTGPSEQSEAKGPEAAAEYGEASRRIQESLGLQARIRSARRGGRLEIRFRDRDELEGLLALLAPTEPAGNERPAQT
jgi:ParB family chromosome partitioning protein